jgi:polyhydroxyalkanoate synthesis regulator protein
MLHCSIQIEYNPAALGLSRILRLYYRVMPERKVVVKKYENRRLYDTAASRYVNLDDVARMVREGVEVQVVDARSGEDLTRVILTQVIMEDAKGTSPACPWTCCAS